MFAAAPAMFWSSQLEQRETEPVQAARDDGHRHYKHECTDAFHFGSFDLFYTNCLIRHLDCLASS